MELPAELCKGTEGLQIPRSTLMHRNWAPQFLDTCVSLMGSFLMVSLR